MEREMDGARVESCPQRCIGQKRGTGLFMIAPAPVGETHYQTSFILVVSLVLFLSLSSLHSHPILFLCINHWAANPGANGLGWWNFFAT